MDQAVSVVVPRPLETRFTYRIKTEHQGLIRRGSWVQVPFGRSLSHAYVVGEPQSLADVDPAIQAKLKDIAFVSDETLRLPQDVLELCEWASRYYQCPLGEVLNAAAPAAVLGLRNKGKARKVGQPEVVMKRQELTADQRHAVEETLAAHRKEKPLLLHGVTGSGKTEVYLELARQQLAQGKSVIILVPEIALTPQLHRRFEEGLGEAVALYHSAVPTGKRRDQWIALRTGQVRVVVGARSAVFAPMQNLGLIVVDEEHEPSYKQEDRFRYQARDLAVLRGNFTHAGVVLGSATPSLETRERVRQGRYGVARLNKRVGVAQLPEIELVDLTVEERVAEIRAPIAKKTLAAIELEVKAGNQVMVFLNRRGFAAFMICQACGESPGCPSCSISLTYHKFRDELRCHLCGFKRAAKVVCHGCQSTKLEPVGAGTESLEEELPQLVPEIKPLRLDRDVVTSASRLTKILDDFRAGKSNTLLGTQMLVKGHDFPGVTLVVVVMADALFRWPDFRAGERAYQILKQVSGRAGRGEQPGRVLLQTFQTEHPVVLCAKGEKDEEDFLNEERELREALHYPPYWRLARIRFEDRNKAECARRARQVAELMQRGKVEVLGPSEAYVEKVKGTFRWDILLKAQNIADMQKVLWQARSFCLERKWPCLVDVDPAGLG